MSAIDVLRIVLVIGIFLFALAPIFIHYSIANPDTLKAHHQLEHMSTFPQRIGKKATIESAKSQPSNNEMYNFASEDEHNSNIPLPRNIGGAGRALLLGALEKRPIWDETIDHEYEAKRCRRYFSYDNETHFLDYKAKKRRRRVFLGSLIADDSWHSLGAIAMETYGVYTAVAFVESNRTQTGTPRKLRFVNGTVDHRILVESNLFGPETPVLMDYFNFEGDVDGGGLIREHMQRNLIVNLWKKAGMTKDDVGILTDADETPTRDMIRAAQMCDMPELDPEKQNCHTAKIVVASHVFEGSPECMTITRKWMHPDIILGKCIEGIGDDKFKLDDNQRQRKLAWRKKEYTQKYTNYSQWPKEKETFPLWNPADFRRDQGGHVIYYEDVDYLPFRMGHTGYHFHNFFESIQHLRKKYVTYGHPMPEAAHMSVGQIQPDLDVMVDCVLGRNTSDNRHVTLQKPLAEYEGRIPIAYRIEGYTMARHMELKTMLLEDPIGHNATFHDNPKSKDWFEKIPP